VSRGKRDQVEEVKSNKTAQIKRTERKKEGGEKRYKECFISFDLIFLLFFVSLQEPNHWAAADIPQKLYVN
jgi:hypothetical protein